MAIQNKTEIFALILGNFLLVMYGKIHSKQLLPNVRIYVYAVKKYGYAYKKYAYAYQIFTLESCWFVLYCLLPIMRVSASVYPHAYFKRNAKNKIWTWFAYFPGIYKEIFL